MNDFLDQIAKFSDPGVVISSTQVFLCLVISFVLSLLVARVYASTYKGPAYTPAFMITLIICGMVISAVMLIIGSNIARAFSLVGALSIVRFRNAVKDPRDVAFIFLVMAIGMACGTGFYGVALLVTFVPSVVLLTLDKIRFGERNDEDRIVRIQAPRGKGMETALETVLDSVASQRNLLSVGTSRMGTEMEYSYSVTVKKDFKADTLIDSLMKVNQNLKVEVVGSQFAYDL